jgi:hypothetical protein
MESPHHTLVLSFILFTLKGSKVDDNTYTYMLLSCWNSLLLYGNLQRGDIFLLSIDSESFEHMKQYFLFGIIYKKLKERGVHLQCNILAPPANLLEGFLWKYIVCSFEPVLQGKAHIYIDADTVCLRPLDRLRKLLYAKEGFILCPEGPLSDGNYSDVAIPKDFLQKFPMLPGCSAGLFAFRLSTAAVQEFSKILQTRLRECKNEPAGYCIEQPYFNYG